MSKQDNKSLDFGKFIKSLRKGKGLTLVKVQEETGISNSYLSQIENNQFTPSMDILKKLASFYGIDYFRLLREVGHFNEEEYETIKSGGLIIRPSGNEQYQYKTYHLDKILMSEDDENTQKTVKYKEQVLLGKDKQKLIKFIEAFILEGNE